MNGKFAVVTGASTGIGRAVAIELVKDGYFIFLIGRNNEKLFITSNLINDLHGESQIILTDLSDPGSIKDSLKTIKNRTKKIDILANIAGVWHDDSEVFAGRDFESFDEKVILDTYSVGLSAPTLLAHAFIPMMTKNCSIINLSGTFENGAKGWLPYYVSKRAIEDLTIGLFEELKGKGIKVNCVSPSDTATEEYKKYFPEDAEGAQTPEEVAKLLVELVKKDVTGKVFVIKNGIVSEAFHR